MAGIALSQLTSRVVRSSIGRRTIKALQSEITVNGVVQNIINGIGMLGRFILRILRSIPFSFSAVWGFFVRATEFIANFNINTSDAQLNAAIQENFDALAGQLGGTLGNAFGYLTCGVLPGAAIFAFNEPLGALILKNVTAEGLDEFVGNLGVLLKNTFALGTQILVSWLFKSARKIIKNRAKPIGQLFGSERLERMIQAWGESDTPAWSFNNAIEERIEAIPNAALRNFIEEFREEAWEGCIESGYVVANTIDGWIASQKNAELIDAQNQQVVVVTPNRNVPDDKVYIAGSGVQLRNTIINTLATHQILNDRDVGMIYGTSDEQPVRGIKPEVVLKFYQKKEDRVIGTDANGVTYSSRNPVTMRVSFRLMNRDESDFNNDTYARSLAQIIYRKLATPPYRHNKGTEAYTYQDWKKGYSMMIYAANESTARSLIDTILEIQGHSIDNNLLKRASRQVAGTPRPTRRVTVFGEQIEIPNPGFKTGVVTFKEAYLNIGNGAKPIHLVDLTGKRRNVVYRP